MSAMQQVWFEKVTPVRTGNFPARIVERGRPEIPVIGTQVSTTGLSFMTRAKLTGRELGMWIVLQQRPVRVRVSVQRSEVIDVNAVNWNRHHCNFVQIAGDDYNFVVRYIKDVPKPASADAATPAVAETEGPTLPSLLSADVQNKIAAALIQMKRLAPPTRGAQPLLRFRPERVVPANEGGSKQRIVVDSRVSLNDAIRSFQTRFTVLSTGEIETEK